MADTVETLAEKMMTMAASYERDMQNIRQELDGLNRTIIMAQGNRQHDHTDGSGDLEKKLEMKCKANQHLMPQEWANDAKKPFAVLSHDVMTYMRRVSMEAAKMMEKAQKSEKEFTVAMLDDLDFPNKDNLDDLIYATLSKITQDEPKEAVRNASRSGVIAWWKLHMRYNPKSTLDASLSLQRILHPVKGKDGETTKSAIEKFETQVREHNARSRHLSQKTCRSRVSGI